MSLELDIDLDTVCRICVNGSTDKLANIFINTIVDGYMISIPDIIQNCLDIKIEKNDPLPQKLCADCKSEVIKYYTFKEKAKRTERLLYKTLNIEKEVDHPLSPISKPPLSSLSTIDLLANSNETTTSHSETTKFHIEINNGPQNDEELCTVGAESLNNVVDDELLDNSNENSIELTIAADEPDVNGDEEYQQHYESIDVDVDHDSSKPVDFDIKLELMDILGDSISEINEKNVQNETKKLSYSNQSVKSEQNNEFDGFTEQCVIEYAFACKFCDKTFENASSLGHHTDLLCLNRRNNYENDLTTNYDDDSQTNIEEDLDLDLCNKEIKLKQDNTKMLYSLEEYGDGDDFDIVPVDDEMNKSDESNADGDGEGDENEEIIIGIKPRINCDKCSAKFRSKTTYDQHVKRHEQLVILNTFVTTYSCQKCHWIFVVQSDYENHMDNIHNLTTNDLINKLTPNDLDSNDEYTDYQYLTDDDYDSTIQHACGQCEILFPNCVQAKFHVVKHIKEFLCPYANCGCVYDTFQRFLFHIENRHIQFELDQCKHCGQKCENYDRLQQHVKNDCVQRKFACSHCDRKFLSKNALGTHLKSIQGKWRQCTFCPKSFATTGELSLHMRSHTNDRPYVCTICYKSYKTSSMRRAHMDAHINGKTFACTICEKKLQTRTCFRNHMKRHTQEKKHACTLCARRFFTKYHLKLHASKIHPGFVDC